MRSARFCVMALTTVLVGTQIAVADNSATGKVATAAARVAEIAKRASVCVEISLSAVENAMAAQDQAEADVMKAMKSGANGRIAATEKKLEVAQDDAEAARELAKKIIACSAECTAAATAADQEAKAVTAETTPRDVASTMKRIDHLVEIAQKALKKAEALAETLKKQWLLPLATTTTTTTQPPSPTPVGRR
jgi:hypothetical protein